jgi:hypothetical protein
MPSGVFIGVLNDFGQVYMAKCENDCVGEDAKNMEWFKTHEWGFDPSREKTDQWASEQMFNNGKKVTFNLPTTLPGGHYIVRNEIIGELSVMPIYTKRLDLNGWMLYTLSASCRRKSKWCLLTHVVALDSLELSKQGPEHYPRAFQINLKSDGTEEPSPKGIFPDIYMQENTRNAHAKYFNLNNGGGQCIPPALGYQIPGVSSAWLVCNLSFANGFRL